MPQGPCPGASLPLGPLADFILPLFIPPKHPAPNWETRPWRRMKDLPELCDAQAQIDASGIDQRIDEERKIMGDRLSGIERGSGVDRQSKATTAKPQ